MGYPNISNFVQNTSMRVVFLTLFLVFAFPDETLPIYVDHVNSYPQDELYSR